MLLKGNAANSALARPDPAIRLYVLGGEDEAGSRAMQADLARAMGADAERIDFTPAKLKDDPAALADEAASMGLFGGRRWISVTIFSGGGDELVAAAENLLDAPAAGNPAVIIGASLTARSKLMKLAEKHPAAVGVISYLPDLKDADRLVEVLAKPLGLRVDHDVALALFEASGGDRAVMAREIEKLALYCDADPAAPRAADLGDWRAIGADLPEEDMAATVNAVLGGQLGELPEVFATLEATSAIPLIRALARRALQLAELRVAVEGGRSVGQVIDGAGKAIFWKEKAAIAMQLSRWDAPRLARLVERLHGLEREMKAPDNAGEILLRAGLLDIARVAASGARAIRS